MVMIHFDCVIDNSKFGKIHSAEQSYKVIKILSRELENLKKLNDLPRHCDKCGKFLRSFYGSGECG